jgi:hypothetical protein
MLSSALQTLFVVIVFFITSSLILSFLSRLKFDFYEMEQARTGERFSQQCYGLLAAKKNILESADLLLQENIVSIAEYKSALAEALALINSKILEINCTQERLNILQGYVFRQPHLGAPKFFPNWVVGYK